MASPDRLVFSMSAPFSTFVPADLPEPVGLCLRHSSRSKISSFCPMSQRLPPCPSHRRLLTSCWMFPSAWDCADCAHSICAVDLSIERSIGSRLVQLIDVRVSTARKTRGGQVVFVLLRISSVTCKQQNRMRGQRNDRGEHG